MGFIKIFNSGWWSRQSMVVSDALLGRIWPSLDVIVAAGMTLISDFIAKVQTIHATGMATEHSYRSAFVRLFTELGVTALNEPKRVKCGAPDFILLQDEIVIGHLEAKDLHIPIRKLKDNNKKQQERYRAALPNLIYTNGLDWDFYCDGNLTASVTIADVFMGGIAPQQDQHETLENLLRDFITQRPQTITSPRELAERMAGKASLIKDILYNTLREDDELQSELADQYQAFKENLIRDIKPEEFADIYAETIAYGMFAARLHDTAPDKFSRQRALELLPKSNPFLRNLFTYVAGYNLDDRIAWIIDDLARVFRACKMEDLMEGFGQLTGRNDPFLHFYETFLAAYNPAKRKARGVWYTPEPVVNFIVRAVDEVLQTEFGLPDGLADTSKVTIDQYIGQDDKGKPVTIKKEVHRVQILDPATGTGTFLAEVVKQIAPRIQGVAPGLWSSYIEADLIPRLHGFELLMASYAMCHMKLDMILTELGYQHRKENPPRLSIYLTNSLEVGNLEQTSFPFARWINREAEGANKIKCDMPIMCVIGNPPYFNRSTNNGDWITREMSKYKKGLEERKVNLNDDYMKFIRLAELLIEKKKSGVVAMITNNSFLDGVTKRKMRCHLRETFDRISIVNLHGDIRTDAPASDQDENVFDITQGVSIAIMRTTGTINRCKLATVYYREICGLREEKYHTLAQLNYNDISFVELNCSEPLHKFLPSQNSYQDRYLVGFKISDFFSNFSSGIQTKQDALCISSHKSELANRLKDFRDLDENILRRKYQIPSDSRDWKMSLAVADVRSGTGQIVSFLYKPFDVQNIYYSGRTKGFVAYPRRSIMQHVVYKDNLCLIVNRQNVCDDFSHAFVTNVACCHGTLYLGNRGQDYCCPLYIYPDSSGYGQNRRVNFDHKLYERLQGLAAHPAHGKPDELTVFDYIYGVLHCPAYRKTYAEFLKIDFPRIPWPSNPSEFWDVSAKGAKLRKLHLMDPAAIGQTPYPFMGEGDDMVKRPRFRDGRVYINTTQYFDSTPEVSWCFYIGGYQPARKWLKDRKGRPLTFDDVKHYQRILKVLSETDRIMGTINMTLH